MILVDILLIFITGERDSRRGPNVISHFQRRFSPSRRQQAAVRCWRIQRHFFPVALFWKSNSLQNILPSREITGARSCKQVEAIETRETSSHTEILLQSWNVSFALGIFWFPRDVCCRKPLETCVSLRFHQNFPLLISLWRLCLWHKSWTISFRDDKGNF